MNLEQKLDHLDQQISSKYVLMRQMPRYGVDYRELRGTIDDLIIERGKIIECITKVMGEAQRQAKAVLTPVVEAAIDDYLVDENTPKTMAERYPHYFKDVRHLDSIDVYRVLELWTVTSEPIAHAIKKLLAPGQRHGKSEAQDIQEAINSLERWKAMRAEDQKK